MKKYPINFQILIPIILLSIVSIFTINSALTYTSASLGNLALKQAIWYGIGWIFVFILIKLKNEYLYRLSWYLYCIGNVLLLLLLFFGTPINNSKCWFMIPGIGSIQPSEFMKIFIMLILATMIHNFRIDYPNPSCKKEFVFLLKTFLIVMIPSVLTFLQPDTGAVLIYMIIYFSMLFVSGIRLRWFLSSGICISLMIGVVLGIYFLRQELFIELFGTSIFYRLERIFNWSQGSGLQLENALAAIGSAGLFGHGYNQTPIYFPESSTDFIFAVFASNFGFMGVIVLLILILFLDISIIQLARKKRLPADNRSSLFS